MMNPTIKRIGLLLGFIATIGAGSLAQAQATRTWISGVGDDVNPCSRTAPCKTFAGAISKTAASGIINVLDPGGFGAVTITKPITIDGGSDGMGGILAAGMTGVNVNAGPNDLVILKNLTIDGVGTGINGVSYLNAGYLVIQNTHIQRFATGINVSGAIAHAKMDVRGVTLTGNTTGLLNASQASTVTVTDTVIRGGGTAIDLSGGITTLHRSSIVNNASAIVRTGGATVLGNFDSDFTDNASGNVRLPNPNWKLQ